ncbi:MAG: ferritin-like domain-containing protein [Phenylobacterium sp.]|uniref:ferritin-like domain-containing protein n=1 Tax=Phenylobacterium sp. TaxID=1871053 RepID=UPI00271A6B41|nr:ferritin-like domain-containing protein [Phenylobacterium sp.]MDO8408831.1 ferritin-like domain-containing protein [Phenylobacterium sp.]
MADGNITKDVMYDAVAPDDFESMLELDRYNARSTAFDKIISATHDHFWDPLDPKYIDFSEPWDMENEALLPDDQVMALGVPYVLDHLEKTGQKVKFINEMVLWNFSSILHGEQGALNLSASLCHVLKDQGAQEYAANQTREEARHVTGFAKYIKARWGRPRPCGATLQQLLVDIIGAPEVYKKIIGMQMLVEGLAMGAFAAGFQYNRDPLAKKLFQLVMTDEAFHHKFGKIWADRTIPKMTQEERDIVEDWAAHCFQSLLFNMGSPVQQAAIYTQFGLDPERVVAEMRATYQNDESRRERLKSQTNIFRVLIKTLFNAGLITDRTRAFYATYVDMDELKAEGEKMVGDDIAEAGIKYLQEINFKDRHAAPVTIAAE